MSINSNGESETCDYQEECFSVEDVEQPVADFFPNIQFITDTFERLPLGNAFEVEVTTEPYCPPPLPSPRFELPDTICVQDCVRPTGMNNLQQGDYEWYLNDSLISTFPAISDICFSETGTYELTHIILANTCPDTFSHLIEVVSPAPIQFSTDTTFCEVAPQYFNAVQADFIKHQWGDNDTTAIKEIATAGIYPLTLTDRYCTQKVNVRTHFIMDAYTETFDPLLTLY
jgi:hypothetical protein